MFNYVCSLPTLRPTYQPTSLLRYVIHPLPTLLYTIQHNKNHKPLNLPNSFSLFSFFLLRNCIVACQLLVSFSPFVTASHFLSSSSSSFLVLESAQFLSTYHTPLSYRYSISGIQMSHHNIPPASVHTLLGPTDQLLPSISRLVIPKTLDTEPAICNFSLRKRQLGEEFPQRTEMALTRFFFLSFSLSLFSAPFHVLPPLSFRL